MNDIKHEDQIPIISDLIGANRKGTSILLSWLSANQLQVEPEHLNELSQVSFQTAIKKISKQFISGT